MKHQDAGTSGPSGTKNCRMTLKLGKKLPISICEVVGVHLVSKSEIERETVAKRGRNCTIRPMDQDWAAPVVRLSARTVCSVDKVAQKVCQDDTPHSRPTAHQRTCRVRRPDARSAHRPPPPPAPLPCGGHYAALTPISHRQRVVDIASGHSNRYSGS